MWKIVLVLLLFAAHLNLTAIVPLQAGGAPPPWWVGGMLFWPFDVGTNTLVKGDLLNTLTPILAISSALLFLMAGAAVLRRLVPEQWFMVDRGGHCALDHAAGYLALRLGPFATTCGYRAAVDGIRPARHRSQTSRVDDTEPEFFARERTINHLST